MRIYLNTGSSISGSMKMELLIESIDKDIIRNPYNYIQDWGEQRLKNVGKKLFSILSLMPVSLIIPDMPYQDKFVKSNIHTLILGGSGSSKTTLVNDTFGEVTYKPITFNDISKAKFVEEIHDIGNDASILCHDIAGIFKNPALIKILEGITGEERAIDSRNMVRDRKFSLNAIFLGAGLPEAITKYVSYGMMRRLCPVIIFHTIEEKDEINKYVKDSMFSSTNLLSVKNIKEYYLKLWNIQKGKDKEFNKVDGYIVDEQFKEGIYYKHRDMSKMFPDDKYLIAELHSGFRYLCSHAMLNFFNRKKEKNKIVIEREDYEKALSLLDLEMRMKAKIFRSNKIVRLTTDVIGLYKSIENDDQLDITFKNLTEIFIREKISNKMRE